ncbi:glycosyltransferase [Microbispora sp. RL4-1S]|uniref:Glycosyltransferase n=1 Tax=Microbispora oryzae TaxID=2806554 RepID=A0A940WHX1_9ACTN|nr:glycosyltransferase family 2 protein [Microbispora oryzae]MBP2706039.1 glycosyltransferase [Microbispora oryzae]
MHSVTAIVVAHDGARWLQETLTAVLRQTRPLDRVVGVDNGSRDGSGRLLAQAFGEHNVLSLSRSAGFGEAVHEVLRRLPAAQEQQAQEWVWLLHDDCAPDAGALQALLWAADQDPKAAILGPKLCDWLDRRVLLEIGVTVSRSGRRDTGLEPREYDQGQHDEIHDVLSVSTAGMLIRRDVWDELSGLDPDLPLFRDDLDLCWRARVAGHRVLNVTDAVAWHAEASSRRRRRISTRDEHPRRLDRRNALFVIMANLPFWALVRSVVRNVSGSLVRTLLFLLAKQPANALDEVAALGSVLGHPGRLRRARKARRNGRKQGYPAVARLLTPPGAALRRLTDMVQGFLAGGAPVDSAGRHHAVAADSSDDDDGDELLTDSRVFQRVLGSPGVLLTFALVAVALLAERRLLTGDLLGGGLLVPVTGSASDLWRFYLEGHHAAGLGSDTWAPPYVAVLAGLSALFLGKTWLAVGVLLLGCVPLAGLSAYAATKRIIPYTPARIWLAATYALLPVATGAVAGGRIGTALLLVLLPVYAGLATRVVAGSRRAAWGLGLLLAVGAAFVPLVYVLVAVLGALAAVSFAGVRKGAGLSLAIGLGTPLLLLLPWLAEVVREPGRMLMEAGLRDVTLADPRLGPESLLLLSPGGPGVPPVWTVAGLIAVALTALLLRRRRMHVVVGWGVMLFGVLVAIVVSRLTAGSMPAWPGVPLAFAATGLLLAAAHPAHRLARLRAAGGVRRIGALLIVVAAFATPLASAGFWIVSGADGPLERGARDPMPVLATLGTREGEGTLLLRPRDGEVAYTLLRGRAPLIGESDLVPAADARGRFGAAVAGLASGRGGPYTQTLASMGVRFVSVPGKIGPELRRALDSNPEMARMSLSDSGGLWRVTVPVTVPPPSTGADSTHRIWLWAQGALLVLVLVLASPGARTAEPEEDYGESSPDGTPRGRRRAREDRVPA